MKIRPAQPRLGPARCHAALVVACGVALALALLGQSASARAAAADSNFAAFDPSMLAGGNNNGVDLKRFEHGNPVPPGVYNVNVYLNKSMVGRMDVRFAAPASGASAKACVDQKLLDRLNLEPAKSATKAVTQLQQPGACVQLDDLIPHAKLDFDMPDLRLDASVPQAYLNKRPRGYVNPTSWDAGVPAFLLNYNFNTYHTNSDGHDQTNSFLGLRAGLNLGRWQFRQDATVTWESGALGTQRHWHNIDAFVRRDFPKLHATLTIGDSHTDGAVFDSYGLRGVQLATQDQMLPPSRRGYAPVIRGVAQTNATVTVRQNGVQIYQTTVAPGPFVINDLYPTGYGGELDVTVTEANGRVHSFSVPYASVAELLRPGVTRFDLAAGRLRDLGLDDQPGVVQATVQHGFSNLFTGYAGVQASEGYAAVLAGGAFNTRFGALALDVTAARTQIPSYGTHTGQSLRITYSKIVPQTDTSLTIAAYRYSTSGFLDLAHAAAARDVARHGGDPFQAVPSGPPVFGPGGVGALLHQRDRFTLTVSQRLGGRGGALYANASLTDYWNRNDHDAELQLGYSNHIGPLNYGLSVTRSRTPLNGYDNTIYLSASLPLGHSTRAPSLSFSVTHDDTGTQGQATLNGTAGAWNQFGYGATVSHASDGGGDALSVYGGYRSPYGVVRASVGKGSDYTQESLNVSGALVAFKGGVLFGQPIGDTVAIVHVPGATGAHVSNAPPGVQVNGAGYALVPFLTPYRLDTIRIDPKGLPLSVQLQSTSAQIAPYAGAAVMVDFKSKAGRALIARIHLADGKPVPFGAQVVNAKGEPVGIVGQGGLALLRGAGKGGQLRVQWQGRLGKARVCSFAYAAPPGPNSKAAGNAYRPVSITCIAGTTTLPPPRETER